MCNVNTDDVTFIEKKELFYYRKFRVPNYYELNCLPSILYVEVLTRGLIVFRDKAFKGQLGLNEDRRVEL